MFFALVIAEKKSTFAHFAALIRWSCWHYPNFVSPKLIEQSIFHNIASFVLVEEKIPIFVWCLKYINRKKMWICLHKTAKCFYSGESSVCKVIARISWVCLQCTKWHEPTERRCCVSLCVCATTLVLVSSMCCQSIHAFGERVGKARD